MGESVVFTILMTEKIYSNYPSRSKLQRWVKFASLFSGNSENSESHSLSEMIKLEVADRVN